MTFNHDARTLQLASLGAGPGRPSITAYLDHFEGRRCFTQSASEAAQILPCMTRVGRAWFVSFVLTMHPWISGREGRMAGLEQLIRAIKAEPGVWWATWKQVAEWQIETRQNLDVTVPIP